MESGKDSEKTETSFCTPVKSHRQNFLRRELVDPKTPDIAIPPSPLLKRLGYGTGVGVFKLPRSPFANGQAKSPWALKKTIKIELEDSIYTERLQYEATILKNLSHPNIIGYRGFVKSGQIALAMEMGSTSLADLIQERFECTGSSDLQPYSADVITRVALDVSDALTYLHETALLLHGDIKSGNVIIFGDFEKAKLCDFGVSRKIKSDGTIDGNYVGTELWSPMEVISSKNENTETEPITVTYKADIYAFGLTLYEMLSLQSPFINLVMDCSGHDESESDLDVSLFSMDESFLENTDDLLNELLGTRPPLPDHVYDSSYNLILQIFYCCSEQNPERRPKACDINKLLQEKESV